MTEECSANGKEIGTVVLEYSERERERECVRALLVKIGESSGGTSDGEGEGSNGKECSSGYERESIVVVLEKEGARSGGGDGM